MGLQFKRNRNEMLILTLAEYCSKLFPLMDSFWLEISSKRVDICWSGRVRGHLDNVQKEQQRIKQKKSSTLSSNSSLKKMVFERFNEHLSHFQFKADFFSNCSPQCPEYENIYTLTTLNKICKNHEKNNASQTCQDESGLLKVLSNEDKTNEKVKKKVMF